MFLVLKRNEASSHEKTWRNVKCTLLNGKAQLEKVTYYKIILSNMTYQKRQTYGDNKKDQRLPGLEEWGGDELAEHRGIVRQ